MVVHGALRAAVVVGIDRRSEHGLPGRYLHRRRYFGQCLLRSSSFPSFTRRLLEAIEWSVR